LEQFLGTGHGLSAATITRLTEQWKHDAMKFGQRSPKDYFSASRSWAINI
jgi:hypothetical protein